MMTKKFTRSLRSPLRLARRLCRENSAVALVEFAFAAPIVLALGMLGTETAYYTITHMQMSQIAMQVADNATRVGEADQLVYKKVYEDDINAVFIGAEKAGESFELFEKGRIIISSLQHNGMGGQTIRWQRCRGAKVHQSSYGFEGDGANDGTFKGMGNSGHWKNLIAAQEGEAVMFVELAYDYEPITPFELFGDEEITYIAAFNVRDSRDLTGLYQTSPASPVASCDVYSADRPS